MVGGVYRVREEDLEAFVQPGLRDRRLPGPLLAARPVLGVRGGRPVRQGLRVEARDLPPPPDLSGPRSPAGVRLGQVA